MCKSSPKMSKFMRGYELIEEKIQSLDFFFNKKKVFSLKAKHNDYWKSNKGAKAVGSSEDVYYLQSLLTCFLIIGDEGENNNIENVRKQRLLWNIYFW